MQRLQFQKSSLLLLFVPTFAPNIFMSSPIGRLKILSIILSAPGVESSACFTTSMEFSTLGPKVGRRACTVRRISVAVFIEGKGKLSL